MKAITGKLMEEKLKRGYTISFFANYFNVTEETFLANLEKTFSKKAFLGYLSRLRKNEKKHINTQSKDNNSSEVIHTVALVESPKAKSIEEISKEKPISQLDKLKLEKEECEALLNALELEHKNLCSQRIQIKNSVSCYKNKLAELKKEIIRYKEQLSILLNELNHKFDRMQNLNSSINETRQKISDINKSIDNLQKVMIWVYDSGEIEIDQGDDLIPDWNDYYNLILADVNSEDFTLKQLKALSKVIAIATKLKSEHINYEIIFECSKLEEFFMQKFTR